MFGEYTERPFEVEPVQVVDAFGVCTMYPDLSSKTMDVDIAYVNRCLGTRLGPEAVRTLLQKMSLFGELSADKAALSLSIPPTRSDVLHPCDVMEDVGIAYGYNNIEWKVRGMCAPRRV